MSKASIDELQTYYSERDPYVEEVRLDTAGLVVFDPVFIDLLTKGFDTNCVQDMSEDELDLLYRFIDYEDGTYDDKYVQALDVWLVNIVNGVENPIIEGCSQQ